MFSKKFEGELSRIRLISHCNWRFAFWREIGVWVSGVTF